MRKTSGNTDRKVTEHEGIVLALVMRQQPASAYQLFKIFEQSPVTSFNASKGQLYPAIRRLKERGFLHAKKVAGDGRNAEELTVTKAGQGAIRAWVRDLAATHIVLEDPLRTRIMSFGLLTREERLEWIARAKALVKQRADVVDAYAASVDVPYQSFVHSSIIDALRVKMEWLDALLYHTAAAD